MKKNRIFVTISLACIMLLALASSAYAETTVPTTQEETSSITEIVVTGQDVYKDAKTGRETKVPVKQAVSTTNNVAMLSTGTGGTAASSGYRNAWIKTTYSFLGTTTTSFKSLYYWTFSGGKVTYMRNNGREIWVRSGFFYKLIRYNTGGPTKMIWNGITNGQAKCWQAATIRASGPIVGEIYEYNPYHEMYAHGNGTWYYKATP